jgi:cbb3-type cytochrome oxidase subunit 3
MDDFWTRIMNFLLVTVGAEWQGGVLTLLLLLQGGWFFIYFSNRTARAEAQAAHRGIIQVVRNLQWTVDRLTDHLDKLALEGPEEVRREIRICQHQLADVLRKLS